MIENLAGETSLRGFFPGAADAVEFADSADPSIWKRLRTVCNGVDDTVKVAKGALLETLAENPGHPGHRWISQLDHPDFARYVASKLGAM